MFCTLTIVLFEINVNFWNFILKMGKLPESIILLIESLQAMNFDYMLLIVGGADTPFSVLLINN